MTPQTYRLGMIRGNVFDLIVDYVDQDDDPIDISADEVEMAFYRGSSEDALFTLTDSSGIIVTGASGRMTIAVTSDQVDSMFDFKNCRYELMLVNQDKTILTGRVDIKVAGI